MHNWEYNQQSSKFNNQLRSDISPQNDKYVTSKFIFHPGGRAMSVFCAYFKKNWKRHYRATLLLNISSYPYISKIYYASILFWYNPHYAMIDILRTKYEIWILTTFQKSVGAIITLSSIFTYCFTWFCLSFLSLYNRRKSNIACSNVVPFKTVKHLSAQLHIE